MGGDVIPPLSDCVQLSVEQYRTKLYDIIRQEKAARYCMCKCAKSGWHMHLSYPQILQYNTVNPAAPR